MSGLSKFRCLACGASFPLSGARIACNACGGLLDVVSELRAFGRTGETWRELFDRRRAAAPSEATRPFETSGVWRFREHVLPDLPESAIVSKPEGATRLYAAGALGDELSFSRLFVKHEGENPTLSFKDRGMTVGVSWARKLGRTDVVCASTGDTSAALASYAAEVPGMRAVVLLPDDDRKLAPSGAQPDGLVLSQHEEAVAKWVFEHGQTAGRGTATLPGAPGSTILPPQRW